MCFRWCVHEQRCCPAPTEAGRVLGPKRWRRKAHPRPPGQLLKMASRCAGNQAALAACILPRRTAGRGARLAPFAGQAGDVGVPGRAGNARAARPQRHGPAVTAFRSRQDGGEVVRAASGPDGLAEEALIDNGDDRVLVRTGGRVPSGPSMRRPARHDGEAVRQAAHHLSDTPFPGRLSRLDTAVSGVRDGAVPTTGRLVRSVDLVRAPHRIPAGRACG